MDKKELGFVCEEAIGFLNRHMVNGDRKKPALFHSIRVGTHLFERGYGKEVVIAGFLHDILEDGDSSSEEALLLEFGEDILQIVKANSKDNAIKDGQKKRKDLINRCIKTGENASIVKAGDILDNFFYYEITTNKDELINHCIPSAQLLLKNLPSNFSDKIFEDLKKKMSDTMNIYT